MYINELARHKISLSSANHVFYIMSIYDLVMKCVVIGIIPWVLPSMGLSSLPWNNKLPKLTKSTVLKVCRRNSFDVFFVSVEKTNDTIAISRGRHPIHSQTVGLNTVYIKLDLFARTSNITTLLSSWCGVVKSTTSSLAAVTVIAPIAMSAP